MPRTSPPRSGYQPLHGRIDVVGCEQQEHHEVGCTNWARRALEIVQIQWWHFRTGFEVDERKVLETDYRRDERLVAASEVST